MDHGTQLALLTRLLARVDAGESEMAPHATEIPVRNYIDPQRAAQEVTAIFRRYPLVIGHASHLASPGDWVTAEALGFPLMAVRDRDGILRAFVNVCRHRGTKLVTEPSGHDRKAFVCPYHGWTYDLAGKLTHIPEPHGFPGLDPTQRGLVPLPVAARHGLLWIQPLTRTKLDLDGFLGPLNAELRGLGLDRHRIFRKVTQRKRTNWKLVIDAFLEGYHVRHLHRNTLHRFFKGLVYVHDLFPPHARLVSSRTSTRELRDKDKATWDIRTSATLYYFLFPNTVLLFHPDFVSLLRLFPDGPDACIWDHEMLIPETGDTPELQPHWEKSFALIEDTVFQREDLAICESIQEGLRSGANESLTVGRYEFMIRHFHDQIDAAIQTPRELVSSDPVQGEPGFIAR